MLKFFISGLLFFTQIATASDKITIGADEWLGYTNADGSGIYFDLLDKIFPEHGHVIKIDSYNRSLHAFKKKKLDLIIGVFQEEIPQAILPNWYLDTEYPLVAFYNKEKFTINQIEDVSTSRTAWLRGYSFKRFLNNHQPAYLIDDLNTGFDMLAKHRIDTLIDFEYNLPTQYKSLFSVYEVMPERRIFIAFQNTQHGKKLAAQFDLKMKALRDSGELLKLFTTEYPHTNFEQFNDELQKIVIYMADVNLVKNFNSDDSSAVNSLNLILGKMNGYKIVFKAFKEVSAIFNQPQSDNACFAYMIKTEERARLPHYIFSQPFYISLGLRLFSKRALLEQNQQEKAWQKNEETIDLPKLFKNSSLSLGIVKNRSYGKEIDQKLLLIPKNNIHFVPAGINLSAISLFKNQIDTLLEYPLDMKLYWPKFSKEKLYSYSIKNAEKYILGSMMCSNTAVGKEFIAKFNRSLATASKSNYFRFVHLQMVEEQNRTEMNHYYDDVFINGTFD